MSMNGKNPMKPFDLLGSSVGKDVLVVLKGGRNIRGTLLTFDQHMNLVLDDAVELEGTEVKQRFGKIIIRGDTVVLVSPI